MKKPLLCFAAFCWTLCTIAQTAVNFTVNVNNGRKPISSLIYGTNTYKALSLDPLNPSITRFGGNRASTYNWETNWSNAGSDYIYNSDNWWVSAAGINSSLETIPGSVIQAEMDSAKKANRAYIVTLQALGYVAADKNGPVSCNAPCNRWIPVFADKPGQSYQYPPDKTDNAVYEDEEIAWLLSKYGPASAGGVKYYQIDNEPELWQYTHNHIRQNMVTPIELAQINETYGKMIRRMDPSARIMGFVGYGWWGLVEVDLNTYLKEMKTRSNAYGKPLIDIFDWHFYPNDLQNFTGNSSWDLLQAPRTLWDPTYYIAGGSGPMGYYGSAPQLIRRYNSMINQQFPGLKMSISEWNASYDESSIFTGLYVADMLGVYGQENIEVATYFDRPNQYAATGFKLFRNYDGNNSTYGDTYVEATTSNLPNATVYASTESSSNDGKLHMIVISKDINGPVSGTFTINGSKVYDKAEVYYFDGSSQNIIKANNITGIAGNTFTYTLPKNSAVHFILTSTAPLTATITAPSIGSSFCQNAPITFSASSSGGTGTINKIEFYDGSALIGTATALPYAYTWTNAGTGTHSITSKVIMNTGSSAISPVLAVTVNELPTATITTGGATTFCTSGSVLLTASTGPSYKWFNGTTQVGTASTYTATTTGTYSLEVTNANGCKATSTATTVTVNALPTATITAGSATTFCTGSSVLLTASSGSSYKWFNGTTQVGTASTYTATTAGSYTVEVTNANGCKATSATTTVTVNTLPTATITPGGTTTFCTGGSVLLTASTGSSYKWFNGTTQVGSASTYTATTTGTYSLEVTNANGCKATSATTTVIVNALPTATITAGGTTTFCTGSSVLLTASSGSSYKWFNGTTQVGTSSTYAAAASGTYTLEITNANGCKATSATTTVTVNTLPTPTITPGGTTTFCTGGSVLLTASSGSSYKWFNGTTQVGTVSSYTATATGSYTVEVTNTYGCKATSAATTVTVNALPTATITAGGTTTFCTGGSVLLTASSGSSYKWFNGTTQVGTVSSYTATTAGLYTVEVTNTNGCKSISDVTTVTVNTSPTATITTSGATTFCSGGSVLLTASTGTSYKWFNGTTQVGTASFYTATAAGSYTVEVTNTNGCKATSVATTVSITAAPIWYQDSDGDGKGDVAVTKTSCTQPAGYVAVAGDACPTDPNKTDPGICGCGFTEQSCISTATINGTTANIIVIPQPFDNTTTIKLQNYGTIQSIAIINASGALVEYKNGINNTEITFGESLAAGLYSVIIQTEGSIYTTKIVKQ